MPRSSSSSESNSAPRSVCKSVCRPVPSNSPAVLEWRSRRVRQPSSACSRSPRPAAAAMASNWSVTLAMALTTTNGRSGKRDFTMLATRSMAVASSTDVPPNFMTITAASGSPNERRFCARWGGGPPPQDVAGRGSRKIALRLEEFGVEQRRSRRAADGVVREHGELVVQNAAWTQASNRYRHSITAVYIEAGLRTVRRIVIDERLRRRQWQLELLRSRTKIVERSYDVGGLRFLPQLHGNRLGVAVLNCYPIAMCRHAESGWLDMITVQSPEQFARLLLHLFFFFGDVGDDIAQNVERGDARISRAADRLHRSDKDRFDAKLLMQRRECNHQSDGRAVRIGDYVAARLLPPALLLDEREMVGVDLRNDERNILLHAKGAGVADHRATGGGKLRLQLASNACVQGSENHARRAFRRGVGHLHLAHTFGDGRLQPPAYSVAVGLPSGAIGSGQPCHLEPGMGFKHLDEALADNSGSAKNSDGDFLL